MVVNTDIYIEHMFYCLILIENWLHDQAFKPTPK